MKRPAILSLVLCGSILGASLGCVSPTPAELDAQVVTVEGAVAYAGGGQVALQTMDLRVTVFGTGLFEGSPTCEPADPHVPATILGAVAAQSSGRYEYSYASTDLHAVTNEACTLGGARLDQAESLEIEASVPADAANCGAYCAGAAPVSTAACELDCSQGGRRIVGRTTLAGPALQASAERALSDDSVTIAADLELDTLGPTVLTGGGPDLQVDGAAAARSARISREYFGAGDCAIIEGCVPAPGSRRVLRFDGVIRNMGDEDFVLGNPTNNPLFHYSSCHGHYHLSEAMKYELLDAITLAPITVAGSPVVGHKQGFCMLDMTQVAGSKSAKFTCSHQGLTSGWADIYTSSLDCQFVDITGVAPGDYVLKVTVNPGGTLGETDKSNNSAYVTVAIPAE